MEDFLNGVGKWLMSDQFSAPTYVWMLVIWCGITVARGGCRCKK